MDLTVIGTSKGEAPMDLAMVVGAQQHQFVELGVVPDFVGNCVVGVAPPHRRIAPGEHAAPVALDQGDALVAGGVATGVGDAQDATCAVEAEEHQKVVNIGVAQGLFGGDATERRPTIGGAAATCKIDQVGDLPAQ